MSLRFKLILCIAFGTILSYERQDRVSEIDQCLRKSRSIIVDRNVKLNRLVKAYGLKYGSSRYEHAFQVLEKKDSLSECLITKFYLDVYDDLLDPYDSLTYVSKTPKEENWTDLKILGSDSVMQVLLHHQKDTSPYRDLLSLNKYKIKRQIVSQIGGTYYGFSKSQAVAERLSIDTLQLGLSWDVSNGYGGIDSVVVDGLEMNTDLVSLENTNYFIPYDFYFGNEDDVELEIIVSGLEGFRTFPYKSIGK